MLSVSDTGGVIRYTWGSQFVLAQQLHPNGGMRVQWRYGIHKFHEWVHRMVAEVWVHNPKPGVYKWVHFWDKNKEHTDAENLYWGRQKPWTFKKKPLILLHDRDDAITYVCRHVVVDDITKCWNWVGTNGRGTFKGVQASGAAMTWTLWKGWVWPDSRFKHTCRNTQCVNPEHLRSILHAGNNNAGS